jgi:hypothetical protein
MSLTVDAEEMFFLAAGADGVIRLWSLDLCECLVVYKGHLNTIWR